MSSDITFFEFKQSCSFADNYGEPKWQKSGVFHYVAHTKMSCLLLSTDVWYEISQPTKIL